jgi:hypothetical protein
VGLDVGRSLTAGGNAGTAPSLRILDGLGPDRARLVSVGVAGGLSIALLALGALQAASIIANPGAMRVWGGADFSLYRDAASGWLSGARFYPADQLGGPFPLLQSAILYPPVALWLFVPFTVLPAFLWWVIPLGLTGWAVGHMRPGPLAWPVMAACVGTQVFSVKLLTGNPILWVQSAVALGCLYSWPAVLVLVKPSVAPFALIGASHRSWWRALGLLALVSLPFGTMWVDWLTSVRNAEGGTLLYSLQDWPFLVLPVAAWLGGRRRQASIRGEPALART